MSIEDKLGNIRTLKPEEIEVRVGRMNKQNTGAFLLIYKDARVDMKILDETFGSMNWQRTHEMIGENLYCNISVYDKEKGIWVTKQDVGIESNADKQKGQASDAFKRAGFNWGIGRELYSAPNIWVNGIAKYDKFKVKHIGYNEDREITELIIVDDKGNEKYKYGVGGGVQTNTTKTTASTSNKATVKQLNFMESLARQKNCIEDMPNLIKEKTGKSTSRELTKSEAAEIITHLQEEM